MKKQIEQRCKSNTYRFGIVVILLGFLQQNFSLIDKYLGDYSDAVLCLVGLLILLFREITKTSLSEKGNTDNSEGG